MTDRRRPDEGLILVPHPSLLPDDRAAAATPRAPAEPLRMPVPACDRTAEEAIHAA